MNSPVPFLRTVALAILAGFLAACAPVGITHVPPGQSLGVALAKKPTLVRLPAPPPPSATALATKTNAAPAPGKSDLAASDQISRVAEAFSRGQFCMTSGNDEEAIKAFQEVVRLDPTFAEAWQNLAALYEKKGDNQKAIEAFRRAKKIASQ